MGEKWDRIIRWCRSYITELQHMGKPNHLCTPKVRKRWTNEKNDMCRLFLKICSTATYDTCWQKEQKKFITSTIIKNICDVHTANWCKFLTTLDTCSSCYHITLAAEVCARTTCVTPFRNYEFNKVILVTVLLICN